MKKITIFTIVLVVFLLGCSKNSAEVQAPSNELSYKVKVYVTGIDLSEVNLNISDDTDWNAHIPVLKNQEVLLDEALYTYKELTDLSDNEISFLYDSKQLFSVSEAILRYCNSNELVVYDNYVAEEDKKVKFEADDEIPCEYWMNISSKLKKDEQVIMYLNDVPWDNMTSQELGASSAANLNLVELTVDLHVMGEWDIYSGSLFLELLYVGDDISEESMGYVKPFESCLPTYAHPHTIYEKIIDNCVEYLTDEGYMVDKRVIISGFSVGGIFAQRFALLSPEYTRAIIAGNLGGTIQMPFETIDGHQLNHPFGIGNYSEDYIAGKEWNKRAYEDIYQLIYTADVDYLSFAVWDWLYREDDRTFFTNTFGIYPTETLYNQAKYIQDNGYDNVMFYIFEGRENEDNHQMCDLGVRYDFMEAVLDGTIDEKRDMFNTSEDEVLRLLQTAEEYITENGLPGISEMMAQYLDD